MGFVPLRALNASMSTKFTKCSTYSFYRRQPCDDKDDNKADEKTFHISVLEPSGKQKGNCAIKN